MSHNIESFKVASTLAAFRIVGMGPTAETVVYPTATSTPILGVSIDTVLDTTSALPVKTHGLQKVTFNDTVAAAGLVTADTNGNAVPYTAATAASWYVGVLVGAAVTATGTVANIMIMPGYASTSA